MWFHLGCEAGRRRFHAGWTSKCLWFRMRRAFLGMLRSVFRRWHVSLLPGNLGLRITPSKFFAALVWDWFRCSYKVPLLWMCAHLHGSACWTGGGRSSCRKRANLAQDSTRLLAELLDLLIHLRDGRFDRVDLVPGVLEGCVVAELACWNSCCTSANFLLVSSKILS